MSTNGDAQEARLTLPVEFGGVSIGKETASIGLTIDRERMSLDAADEFFVGKRLDGVLGLGAIQDPHQSEIFDNSIEFGGAFDVKRIGVNVAKISARLTFSLATIDVAELAKFSKGSGRLTVHNVQELPDAADDDFAIDDSTPGTLRASGPWRDVQLDGMFGGAILKSLKKAGLETVGALSDYTASERRLTDIEGIGPGKAANIEERMMGFWRDNPQYCDGAEGSTAGEAASELAVGKAID